MLTSGVCPHAIWVKVTNLSLKRGLDEFVREKIGMITSEVGNKLKIIYWKESICPCVLLVCFP